MMGTARAPRASREPMPPPEGTGLTAPTRFVLSCAARTGSTMLEYMLRSHPDVLMHGEVFHVDHIGTLDGRYDNVEFDAAHNARLWQQRVEDLTGFLRDVVWDPQGSRVVGFKFKTDEAFEPEWADVAAAIATDNSAAIIHLRRRDLLAQYISHEAVLRHSGPMMSKDREAVVEPFAIDVEAALRYAEQVRARDRRALELYAGHRSMIVEYERLNTDAICAFLGIRPMPLTTSTVRLIRDHSAVVTNYRTASRVMRRHGPDAGAVERFLGKIRPAI